MEPHESPQSRKVVNVIITLPPADNPSLGKTITSISVSDSVSTPPQQPHHPPQHLQIPIGLPIPSNPEHQTLLKRSIFGTSISGLGLVSVSLVSLIFFLWVSGTPNALFESHSPEADNDQNSNGKTKLTSFIFPLYPKLGIQERSQRDVELKLGRFVDFNEQNIVSQSDDGVQLGKTTKTVSKGAVAQSTTVLPVKGNVYPYGLYYTYMLVGSPPRPYFLDMDTGSDLAWIQCDAPCTSCAKGPHSLYKPKKGNIIPSKDSLCAEVQRTQRNGYCDTCQCDYEVEYADNSSSIGVLARDELHLMTANGSVIKLNVAFGCAYDQQGLLLNSLAKTDGILGLSRAKVSLPYQLASQGIIKNVIGHCLTSDAGGDSYMFLGNDFVPHRQMAWVPMLNNSDTNLYLTDVAKMTYGSKLLSLDGMSTRLGRAVFDSGSSYTYFPKQAYSDLLANLKGGFGEGLVQDSSDTTLPICWQSQFPIRSIMDVKRFFKPLTLEMGRKWWMVSTKLRIPPEGYLIISNKGNVCLGILDGSKVYDGSTIILGDISLHGKLVVYDNLNHKIGWMQSDCVKPLRFNSLPFV